ncbi:MAG: hypothetical protein ACR2PO_10230 [Methyloligellaceae bacterium]
MRDTEAMAVSSGCWVVIGCPRFQAMSLPASGLPGTGHGEMVETGMRRRPDMTIDEAQKPMVFKIDDEDRYDWDLLQNGAINLYFKHAVFEEAITSLEQLGYHIIRLRFDNEKQFEADMTRALKWQQQFGYSPWNGNLDALNDGFRDEPFNSADDTAFCIENFQACVAHDGYMATTLLDILARTSRNYLLFGKRLIGLIQTNDPEFDRDGLGGTTTHWNEAEWLNSARGL